MKKNFQQDVDRFEELMISLAHNNKLVHPPFLSKWDLTFAQCAVLHTLAKGDNCKMSDISHALNVTLSNITGMIDRLEADKIVKRVADKKDRRITRIKLCRKGKNIIKKMATYRKKNLNSLLSNLNNKDRKTLISIIEKITTNPGGKKHGS